jgi:predicted ATPase
LPNTQHETPIVGRLTELAQLRKAVRTAPLGAFTSILVLGEPGIGKTRLIRELCATWAAEGLLLRARCSRLEQQIPLVPLVDALRTPTARAAAHGIPDPWRGIIQEVLPELACRAKDRPALEIGSRRLVEAIRRLLLALPGDRLVLWLDDFQWADHTTATVLEYCRRRWEGGSLVFVASVRAPVDQASDSTAEFIRLCQREGVALELGPLADDDTIAIGSRILGRDIPPPQRREFLALTDNIPLYATELAYELSQGRVSLERTDPT